MVDGPDGAGKSTQCRRIAEALVERDPLLVRDPGSTPVAERIREILLDVSVDRMAPRAEMLLYMAGRADLVEHEIRPALAAGRLVVCDRFASSTYAYQGFGSGLDREFILSLSEFATQGCLPDLWILLDIDPELSLARKREAGDRIQSRNLAYHRRVREGFRHFAGRFPNAAVIDADRPEEVVFRDVMEALAHAL